MKTTLDIDNALLIKAKALAARERKSLGVLVEEGLRLRMGRHRGSRARRSLPVYRGKSGLAEGIDPNSNRAMLEATRSRSR